MPRATNSIASDGAHAKIKYPASAMTCEISTIGLRPTRSLSAPQNGAATAEPTAIVASSAPTSTPLAPNRCA
jgi:hypothetical protein